MRCARSLLPVAISALAVAMLSVLIRTCDTMRASDSFMVGQGLEQLTKLVLALGADA